MISPHDFAANQYLSAGPGNAAGGESRPCAPGPARGLRAQAATADVADSAERRSPAGQYSAPAPDESNRHSAAFPARSADRGPIHPQADAALGSGAAQSGGGGAAGRTLAIHEMDDATLESAAILAAMTHQQSGDRAAWDRLVAINAERRKRKQVGAA